LASGHTQGSLAAASGVSKATIERCDHGHVPSIPVARSIAQALGIEDAFFVFPDLRETP